MKTLVRLATLLNLLFVLSGCAAVPGVANPPSTDNVQNFRAIDASKSEYRGGQPDFKDWKAIHDLGVTNVVKLNGGRDLGAEKLGMTVHQYNITIFEQIFGVSKKKVRAARNSITPGTYLHCTRGQDRTGLVAAEKRVQDGWSKDDAQKEMLDDGFHKSLFGLWWRWLRGL